MLFININARTVIVLTLDAQQNGSTIAYANMSPDVFDNPLKFLMKPVIVCELATRNRIIRMKYQLMPSLLLETISSKILIVLPSLL